MLFLPLVYKRNKERQMSLVLLYGLLLMCAGFICSGVMLNLYANKANIGTEYVFYKDPWLGMFVLTFISIFSVCYLVPDFNDIIVPFGAGPVWALACLAFLVYVAFLLENDKLFYIVLAAASLCLVFMMPDDVLIFDGLLSYYLDRLASAFLIFVFSASAQWLNNMAGVFSMQSVALTAGLWGIAIIGGVSRVLGFVGAVLAGVWLGYLILNRYPSKVAINNGACSSAAFVFSGLMLDGAVELAGPSMVILAMYPLTEIIWAVVRRYVFGIKQRDWSENTAYMSIADKGVEAEAVSIAVGKIGVVNVVLACFQLFSVNGFSIPLFAFAVDLWLLGMLYNIDEKNKSFKEINQDFIGNVKSGLRDIKKSVRKGKKKK